MRTKCGADGDIFTAAAGNHVGGIAAKEIVCRGCRLKYNASSFIQDGMVPGSKCRTTGGFARLDSAGLCEK
jgi:hypothetical protein